MYKFLRIILKFKKVFFIRENVNFLVGLHTKKISRDTTFDT